jgi:hypothetical protein
LAQFFPVPQPQGAEAVRQSVTGKPTKGKEGEFSTQLAMAQQIGELGATQYRNQMGIYTSTQKDLSKPLFRPGLILIFSAIFLSSKR